MRTMHRVKHTCRQATLALSLLLGFAPAANALDYVFRAVPPVAGGSVSVDGKNVGTVDHDGYAILDGIGSGSHSVVVRDTDGRRWGPRSLEFDALVNVLPSFDTSAAPMFDIVVVANAAETVISSGGRVIAMTGPDGRAIVSIPFGAHRRITLGKTGFIPVERVIVAGGRDREVTVTLAKVTAARKLSLSPLVLVAVAMGILTLVAAAGLVMIIRRERTTRDSPRKLRMQPLVKPISFDRYRLTHILGSGGLATVYRATDAVDARPLAVKILGQQWIDDPEMVQKFFAEAEALEAIRKVAPEAAVVRCFTSGREGGRVTGQPYIAMELLEGETLEEFFARAGTLPENVAAAIGAQIAWALSGAHESGVIHRDLTPDNIFLLDKLWRGCADIAPRVVVIDFGVARVEILSKSTLEISISGKPGYMSPEQTSGHAATPQMDLYALGAVLYQMAAGRPPFSASTPTELMELHAHAELPELPASVSDPYCQLVRALMEKNPDHRPLSAMMVAGRLESIADGTYADSFDETFVAG
jgi:Protein kinase domain